MAAHLHRDEETPHIHVTLVPIVKGERKRRKREEQTKKRYRKKPTDTVRLCADDIMTRLKLKSYQDTYAEAMVDKGIIVRNRSSITLCQDCLRITIGTRPENDALLEALRKYKP